MPGPRIGSERISDRALLHRAGFHAGDFGVVPPGVAFGEKIIAAATRERNKRKQANRTQTRPGQTPD